MIAEVAAHYPGLGVPIGDLAWGLFLELVERVPRFNARNQLAVLDGTHSAVAAAFSAEDAAGEIEDARDALIERAHPIKRAPIQRIIRPGDEGFDG